MNKAVSFRYKSLLDEARVISMKSAIASSFGVGIPFLLILIVTAVTIYCSGVMVNDNLVEPGFVMQVNVISCLPILYILKWNDQTID